MNIKIICVGKIKKDYLSDGIIYYLSQIRKNNNLEIIEIKDEKTDDFENEKIRNTIKIKEGNKIINKINKNDYVILLDVQGKEITTNKFKSILNLNKNTTIVIGGSLGVSDEVKSKCNIKISFSKMTFTHQIMRIILLEQISLIL